MHFCFVSTSRGSYFMTELLATLAVAVEAEGHSTELVLDEFPQSPRADDIYVVVPHEFDAWGDSTGFPDPEQRARTIALCTENPGTKWFEATAELVATFGASVSINRSSAAELSRRGVRCEHLQLGYSPRWDSWRGEDIRERDVDVLYLGAADPRRDPLLAGIGTRLWARRCEFLVPPLEPRTQPRPDFLIEQDKYARLGRARVPLNLHRTTSAALEWMRFLEAICNGCVVVSEPCLDGEPLIAGRHFVEEKADRIADAVDQLLDDPGRLRTMRDESYGFIRRELPMEAVGKRLAQLASELPLQSIVDTVSPTRPHGHATPAPPVSSPPAACPSCCSTTTRWVRWHGEMARKLAPDAALRAARSRVRRRLRRVDALAQTAAYRAARPRVTALVVLDSERARESLSLLESVAESTYGDLEILVAADARESSSGELLARLSEDRPTLAVCVVHTDVSSVSAARNILAERARGSYVLALTGGGTIFPSTVARLARALDADPHALFSYPMTAVFEEGVPIALRGSLPWEPQRLVRGNWIDAPVLIRRRLLMRFGGYSTEPGLQGLEDFELWCRCACTGGHGVHVPQVLGSHPALDNAGPDETATLPSPAYAALRQRYPSLFTEQPAPTQ
jgi:hypothetical protein